MSISSCWKSRLVSRLAGLMILASAARAVVSLQATPEPDGSLILELDFPPLTIQPEQVDGRLHQRLLMEGAAWIGQPGAPDLPAYYQLIQIPDRSGVRLEVLAEESEPLHGLLPCPVQDRLHSENELPLPWLEDSAIYGRDADYPGRLVELDHPMLMRDRRLVKACFYPVQVNPVTGEGRVLRHLRLRVSFAGEDLENAGSGPLDDPTPALDALIRPQLLRPGAPEAGELEAAAFNPGRLPGHYLIFAKTAALNVAALQDYIQWKRRRGHQVTVVSNSDISFTASAIRNRIIEEYAGADPVDFVLLVGDTGGTFGIPTGGASYDHYYAMIAGNDILGDVAVGRLSCSNATQLSTICNKIRGYESTPYLEDDDWLAHACHHVGVFCALSMKVLSRSILAEMVARRGYDNVDSNFCVGSDNVVSWFYSGISYYNYRGYIGMDSLPIEDVRDLLQGPRTPVATIFTCGTGDFDGDCFTEAFLQAGAPSTPGGAVAALGFATSNTHTRYNNVVVGGYYAGLLEHDLPEVGACLLQGKYELYRTLPPSDQGQAANFSNWANLMGDPGTCQWAGRLAGLEVAGLPDSLGSGDDHLELVVSSAGQPLAEVAVCVYQDQGAGELLQETRLTDMDGRVLLSLEGLQAGQLQVTATHRRCAPLLAELAVEARAADPAIAATALTASALRPGAGPQTVDLTLGNAGTEALRGLGLSFSLAAEYGDLTAPPQSPADLAPGVEVNLSGISLSPAPTLSDGGRVPLRVQVTSQQGDFERCVWLPVAAPLPSLSAQSTPGGPLLPGQTRALRLSLTNLGTRPAENLLVELACDQPLYGQVASPPQSAGTLAPGGTASVDFDILVSPLAMVGYQLPLALAWSTSGGAEGLSELLATVGSPGAGDPTGPDGYGYWAFEDDDAGYDLAPTYDWIPIAPSEGGQGTEVPLTDNGNEQDDALTVPLPFPFTYYGVVYHEALVCSNGFIAFDDSGYGEVEFRNHYLPSGMGPDAMIAPMWDDHLTTGAAGVWQWFDAVQHRFVITWKGLPANESGGPNTFQLVLYDPLYYPTLTGDGPFLFQYQDFNDTQNSATDFPYCTIGIKDESSTRGMTLRNQHSSAPTLHTIADNTAILFTTSPANSLTPPTLALDANAIALELVSPEAGADSLRIRNEGQLPLLWSAGLLGSGLALRDEGGPDGFGYVWQDSQEEGGPTYQWQEPAARQDLAFNDHDALSPPLELGYTQFLYGRAFSQVRVSPNGYVVFGPEEGGSQNLELPDPAAPSYLVAAWWDDLKPTPGQPDQVWWWSNQQDSLVVAWDMVPHFNSFIFGGPIQAQLVMRAGGEITLQLGYLGGGLYPVNRGGTCGVQGAAGEEGFTFIHNEDASALLPWALRLRPPAWVETEGPTNGMLAGGDSTVVRLRFTSLPGFPLPDGTYTTSLRLATNDLDQLQLDIPITLTVTGSGVAGPGRPARTELREPAPNPFNPTTILTFELGAPGRALLRIFDLRGREVATLLDGPLAAGSHRLAFDGGRLASGLYFARLEAGGVTDTRKLILMK